MNSFRKILSLFVISAILALIILACNKDEEDKLNIPYVFVDLTIDPKFNNLNNVGDVEVFTGGYRGVIIYRASLEEFIAFERTCTYDPEKICSKLYIDPGSQILAIDTCCGSTFLLLDGIPTKGPATIPLLQYRTQYDPVNSLLRVYN